MPTNIDVVAPLQAAYQQLAAENNKLRDEIGRLTAEKDKLQGRYEEASESRAAEKAAALREREDLARQNETLHRENKELKDKVLRGEVTRLQNMADVHETTRARHEATLARMEATLARHEATLKVIQDNMNTREYARKIETLMLAELRAGTTFKTLGALLGQSANAAARHNAKALRLIADAQVREPWVEDVHALQAVLEGAKDWRSSSSHDGGPAAAFQQLLAEFQALEVADVPRRDDFVAWLRAKQASGQLP